MFILGGGDYAYFDKDNRFKNPTQAIHAWFNQFQPLLSKFPFMPQFGNHEIFLNESFSDWSPYFRFPKNYTFRVCGTFFISFFVPNRNINNKHLEWLTKSLENASKSDCQWIIVYQHQPIYACGKSHPANSTIKKKLVNLLEKYKVDIHISGHDQNYERTFPIIHTKKLIPKIQSMSLDSYKAKQGTIYMKVSPSGKMSDIGNNFSKFTKPQQEYIAKRDDHFHHYALFTISNNKLIVKILELDGNKMEKVFDQFELHYSIKSN